MEEQNKKILLVEDDPNFGTDPNLDRPFSGFGWTPLIFG